MATPTYKGPPEWLTQQIDAFDLEKSKAEYRDALARLSDVPAVGDIHSDAKGTGARYNSGKAPLEYVPLHLLEGAARVFKAATEKPVNPYPLWNWAKGMPWLVPLGCMKRHIAAIERGEDRDADTGELHIDHVICNALMLKHYYAAYPEGDNRCVHFKPTLGGEG